MKPDGRSIRYDCSIATRDSDNDVGWVDVVCASQMPINSFDSFLGTVGSRGPSSSSSSSLSHSPILITTPLPRTLEIIVIFVVNHDAAAVG